MAVRLAQASKGETGYTGQQAGNQTGSELNIRQWYSRPWDTILRPYDRMLGQQIAYVASVLVSCKNIGYDQSDRTTLYDECARIGWNLARLSEIRPCECDCSSLIAVILRFCGISITKYVNTSSMTVSVQNTGLFDVLREPQYLNNGDYLLPGDIVLNTWHHVAVCLDAGGKTMFSPYAVRVNVQSYLQVREGPGSGYREFGVSNGDGTFSSWRLPPALVISIVEERDGWGRVGDTVGWVCLKYTTRI